MVLRGFGAWVLVVAFATPLAGASRAYAQAGLPVAQVKGNEVRVDGDVGEWRGIAVAKLGDDPSGAAQVSLAYTPSGLFVAARVQDDEFVRTASPGPREDAIVVELGMPNGTQLARTDVWLFAGRTGRTKAAIAAAPPGRPPRPLGTGAQIVEGPSAGGYALEAFVPWSSLEHGEGWPFVRGAVRLHDADESGERSVRSEGATADELPHLLLDGGPVRSLSAFLRDKSLGTVRPRFDYVARLRDGGPLSRVLVIGTFIVVLGADGRFSFDDLPVTFGADVLSAQAQDQTGDGRPELVLRLRQREGGRVAEVTRAFDLSVDPPRLLPSTGPAPPEPAALVTRREVVAAPQSVVYPQPPGTDELVAEFRRARGVPASNAPRFLQHANLAEDRRIESLLLLGTDLVVVGEGFREGLGYFYFGLPVVDASDVLRVFTGDVTCDGRREIFVRVRQRIGDVRREILLGYTLAGEGVAPIVAVEVRRAQGGSSVGNVVSLVRAGRCFALRIDPGAAVGWTLASYPFEAGSRDEIAPLRLPWSAAPARYRWDGQTLAPSD